MPKALRLSTTNYTKRSSLESLLISGTLQRISSPLQRISSLRNRSEATVLKTRSLEEPLSLVNYPILHLGNSKISCKGVEISVLGETGRFLLHLSLKLRWEAYAAISHPWLLSLWNTCVATMAQMLTLTESIKKKKKTLDWSIEVVFHIGLLLLWGWNCGFPYSWKIQIYEVFQLTVPNFLAVVEVCQFASSHMEMDRELGVYLS